MPHQALLSNFFPASHQSWLLHSIHMSLEQPCLTALNFWVRTHLPSMAAQSAFSGLLFSSSFIYFTNISRVYMSATILGAVGAIPRYYKMPFLPREASAYWLKWTCKQIQYSVRQKQISACWSQGRLHGGGDI